MIKVLWEVLQIGNLIANPKHMIVEDGEYAQVTTVYAWWYRPVVSFVFWLTRCECHYHEVYGWVVHAGCRIHD